ncbi:PDZ domain-containing protein GIPC3-like isoform X1 [Schistocerca americana]|uniref:PDZ domain-containing protein GIPC3 n=2 Tax=Schistocerca TaxID=7008 RepID=UPI001F4FABA9|nr:PDZ domain-containing protein GIPC3-like isoform X1 [Schistocerca americana]XP_046984930.1 PDZ domain-containing protein GIPC3-like isoform X1 [Schistocerca americana]XP_046984931.1 PDZ domain-containing protein GIPC3-like isoform X1 [Schistocerca americana]XP_047102713.1 PDZ domain-containing protein GIPC3 isoform X1 [Schistocerca piceifrons]XP_047102714.1 PDZ domain-containing protein GIPC3 isoform X1 [Schistocerca piceifrons]XP_049955286.1 PDZ domain-containing protein GIPC3 [Schistocerc
MPLFKPKNPNKKGHSVESNNENQNESALAQQNGNRATQKPADPNVGRPKLVFHCQQAQGSPTGLISGFSNVRELYQKIAECYEFPVEDILFCTLNTHKVDMSKLLGGQIGLDDFIFVHRKGRPKEIEITKTEDALGLTITDNGAGYAFIKRIKEGSIIDGINVIQVGDHIEKINNENLVGRRHFEVAKMLKEIPKDTTFTLRLVEPLKDGFTHVGPHADRRKNKKPAFGSGKETIRFSANGPAQIQPELDDVAKVAIDKINSLLDSFMGINDAELATLIWEQAQGKANSMDFAEAVDNSELEEFGFSDDFIIELWGAITDARSGRLN